MGSRAAELVIRMDHTLGFKHEFRGDPALMIPLLGATRFTEDWLVQEIKVASGIVNIPLCEDDKVNSLVIEVPKEVAAAHYYAAMDKIRDRLAAITNSDQQAIFAIDPSLLKNL